MHVAVVTECTYRRKANGCQRGRPDIAQAQVSAHPAASSAYQGGWEALSPIDPRRRARHHGARTPPDQRRRSRRDIRFAPPGRPPAVSSQGRPPSSSHKPNGTLPPHTPPGEHQQSVEFHGRQQQRRPPNALHWSRYVVYVPGFRNALDLWPSAEMSMFEIRCTNIHECLHSPELKHQAARRGTIYAPSLPSRRE